MYEDEETEPVCVIIRYHKKILILLFNNNIMFLKNKFQTSQAALKKYCSNSRLCTNILLQERIS